MLVSVYIRKSDEEAWRVLNNKTELVHQMIISNSNMILGSDDKDTVIEPISAGVPKPRDDFIPANPYVKARPPIKKAPGSLCPHGNAWMMCKVASCNVKGRKLGLLG